MGVSYDAEGRRRLKRRFRMSDRLVRSLRNAVVGSMRQYGSMSITGSD